MASSEVGYGITQTPHVYLDHQIIEDCGDLVYNWDCVDALFPARLLDDMFDAYHGLLEQLATGDSAGATPPCAHAA